MTYDKPMQSPPGPSVDARDASQPKLRGDYRAAGADYSVAQNWSSYTPQQHELWRRLLDRQLGLAARYGAPQALQGIGALDLGPRIPDFEAASRILQRASGFRIVAVPGLIPEQHFFAHLAERRFPVTVWLREPAEMDYLVEPDLFHDFFGHVPLLCDPVFADFVQAYGEAGRKASQEGGLPLLARLYWYTVEFGLMRSGNELRAYGAGILSSAGETAYCIESAVPHRIAFDLERVMRSDYSIDTYQQTYFVIDSFEQLFRAAYDRDFTPIYRQFRDTAPIAADRVLPGDALVTRGTQAAN